jgi:DNA-binding MarR family transcriptional regulator
VLLRMEETGLIIRERMAHDQRRVRVSLTARSRKLAQQLIPRVEQRYQALEASLGLGSIQEVYDALDALLERTLRIGGAQSGAPTPQRAAQRRRT